MKPVLLRDGPGWWWLLVLALAACSSQDDAQELDRWLEEVRSAAPAKAPPPPQAPTHLSSRPALEPGLGRLQNPFAQDPL